MQRETCLCGGREIRSLFSDVENINYIGIGLHKTLESNAAVV